MAKKTPKRTKRKKTGANAVGTLRARPVRGVFLLTLGVLSFAAIASFDLRQSPQWTTAAQPGDNLVGIVGTHFAYYLFYGLGLSCWLLPFFLLWGSLRSFTAQAARRRSLALGMTLIAILSASGLSELLAVTETLESEESLFQHQLPVGFGGLAGDWIAARLLHPYMGTFGCFMLLAMGFSIGTILAITDNSGRWLDALRKSLYAMTQGLVVWLATRKENWAARRIVKVEKARLKAEAKAARAAAKQNPVAPQIEPEEEPVDDLGANGERPSLLRQPIAPLPGQAKKNRCPA